MCCAVTVDLTLIYALCRVIRSFLSIDDIICASNIFSNFFSRKDDRKIVLKSLTLVCVGFHPNRSICVEWVYDKLVMSIFLWRWSLYMINECYRISFFDLSKNSYRMIPKILIKLVVKHILSILLWLYLYIKSYSFKNLYKNQYLFSCICIKVAFSVIVCLYKPKNLHMYKCMYICLYYCTYNAHVVI